MKKANLSTKKRIRIVLLFAIILLVLLSIRIGWIQFVQGEELQSMAYMQQALNRNINPKRGTIYDSTGKSVLAVSSSVETVTINPVNIDEKDKEKVANILSNIFELDYEKTLKKVKNRSSIETIVKKIDKEKADKLRIWMKENGIDKGINIDEDTKRYYPNNNLAAHFIGFVGADNQGLDGIEARYDNVLKGESGKIEKITDARGGEINNETEKYISAIDGKNIVLSIDMTIQSIAEKYLKKACIDNICTDGGNIIVMNPKTGDILAMSTYPDYNLNNPYEAYNEELKNNWDSLAKDVKTKELQKVWRNRAIADTYEPGSTFKLITTSAALEEGITTTDKAGEFNCSGSIEVAGVRIKCWRHYRPHGLQSLRDGLMNSCNPVFIGLGQKLGKEKYYSYLKKFGFLDKTDINLPGEAKGIFLSENKVGPVELATISFGQRFEVTPLQMVTAISSIANNGIQVKPRVVKEIIDPLTGEKEEIPIQAGNRVISEETSKNILSMMETVVSVGTGKNAQVKGFLVGGKTGTSEDGVDTNKYVTSFIGVAPISDPNVVVLVVLYNPTGEGGHQGGGVAAPLGGEVLSEILPYLELIQDNVLDEDKKQDVEVPEIRNMTISDAEKVIKEKGLKINLENLEGMEIDKSETLIRDQIPKPGIRVKEESGIYIVI